MAEKWIAGAIKRPGALSAAAKKAGALSKDGTIKTAWIQQQAKSSDPRRSAQARLALNLAKMRMRRR
jgi:hypothetical protein